MPETPADSSPISGPRLMTFQPPQGDLAILAGSANPKLARDIAGQLGVTLVPIAGAVLQRGKRLRPRPGKRPRARRVRHSGGASPGQRQFHGAAVLDRRPQARQRPAGDGRHSLLQLRQGRQERRAARFDSGPRLCRRHRSGRLRPRLDDGPAQPADSGVLSHPRSITCTAGTCCATTSASSISPIWSCAAPISALPKTPPSYAHLLGTPVVIGNKTRPAHDEKAVVLEVIGDVRDKNVLLVDDFTITGGTLIAMAETLKKPRRPRHLCRRHARRSVEGGVGADRGERHQADVHHRHDRSAARSLSRQLDRHGGPLFAQAIRSVHDRTSVSNLFPEKPIANDVLWAVRTAKRIVVTGVNPSNSFALYGTRPTDLRAGDSGMAAAPK